MAPSQTVALRMSAAGDCPRLLDYKLQHGRGQTTLASAMRLLTGEPIHDFYRGILTDAFPEDYGRAEEECALTLSDGQVVLGHFDGVIKSLGLVVEVKSVGLSTYTMVINNGAPLMSHALQGNLYCGVIKCSGVLFIYHNRDSGEYTTMITPFDQAAFDLVVQKFEMANSRAKTKEMHPRPYNDVNSSPCFFCDNRQDCYRDFDSKIASMDTRDADPESSAIIDAFLFARDSRLGSEKVEGKLKASVIDRMIGLGAKVMKHGETTLEIKVGKTGSPLLNIRGK